MILINSDPTVILVFLAWLRLVGITDDRLQFRLSIHRSADVVGATARWSEVIGFGPDRFEKPSLKRHSPTTVRHNTSSGYIGCLIVRVRRSVHLNRQIAGWWAGIGSVGVDTIGPPSGMV